MISNGALKRYFHFIGHGVLDVLPGSAFLEHLEYIGIGLIIGFVADLLCLMVQLHE